MKNKLAIPSLRDKVFVNVSFYIGMFACRDDRPLQAIRESLPYSALRYDVIPWLEEQEVLYHYQWSPVNQRYDDPVRTIKIHLMLPIKDAIAAMMFFPEQLNWRKDK